MTDTSLHTENITSEDEEPVAIESDDDDFGDLKANEEEGLSLIEESVTDIEEGMKEKIEGTKEKVEGAEEKIEGAEETIEGTEEKVEEQQQKQEIQAVKGGVTEEIKEVSEETTIKTEEKEAVDVLKTEVGAKLEVTQEHIDKQEGVATEHEKVLKQDCNKITIGKNGSALYTVLEHNMQKSIHADHSAADTFKFLKQEILSLQSKGHLYHLTDKGYVLLSQKEVDALLKS